MLLFGLRIYTACVQVVGLRLNCTDVAVVKEASASDLQHTLYCGYYAAHCNGTKATNRYVEGSGARVQPVRAVGFVLCKQGMYTCSTCSLWGRQQSEVIFLRWGNHHAVTCHKHLAWQLS